MAYPKHIAEAYTSKRLVYRAMEDDDEDKAFISEHLQNDPACTILGSARLPVPSPESDAKKWLEYRTKAIFSLFICLPLEEAVPAGEGSSEEPTGKRRRPRPIGFISLFRQLEAAAAHHRNAMIGVGVITDHRGKGYGSEAIDWALDFGFRRAGLHRIAIAAWSYNTTAVNLYRKLGFVEEGREREAVFYDRKWYDAVTLGMLEHEWEKLRGVENS